MFLVNRHVTINEAEDHLRTWKWCMYGSLLSQKPLLPDGIQKLNQCWTVGIDKLGNYVGRGHSSKFYNAHVLIVENILQIPSDRTT